MDGRWKRVLAGAALAGLAGCTTTQKVLQPITGSPPTNPNAVVVPEPADDEAAKDGPLSARTKLIYASMCVEAVAKDAGKPAAERERMTAHARQIYQEVLADDPKNANALMGLGDLYAVTGEQGQLTEVLARAGKTHPTNAKVWAWVAVKHGQARNWPAACDAYARAVKLDPDNRLYRMHWGFTLARAGRYEEGYAALARAMREPEARYNLAMMMVHNGETDRARGELRLALQVDPNFGPAAEKLTALETGSPVTPTPQVGATPNVPAGGIEELPAVQLGGPR
jgi:tetratricopeptide (TPR) repeat protein